MSVKVTITVEVDGLSERDAYSITETAGAYSVTPAQAAGAAEEAIGDAGRRLVARIAAVDPDSRDTSPSAERRHAHRYFTAAPADGLAVR